MYLSLIVNACYCTIITYLLMVDAYLSLLNLLDSLLVDCVLINTLLDSLLVLVCLPEPTDYYVTVDRWRITDSNR